MHLLASASVVIRCPQGRAFDFVANLENFPRWFPGVLHVRPSDSLPHATPGKRYEETLVTALRGTTSVVIRVMEGHAPRRLVTEGTLPLLMPRMEIEVEDAGPAGCELHWRMLSRNTAPVVRWTVLPLAARVMQRRAQAAMPRLKRLLEASPAARDATVQET